MSLRRLFGALVVACGLVIAALVAPAQATPPGTSSITVRVSDHTPLAGQVFIVRGRYVHEGSFAAGHIVRLQTYADGAWSNITGARVAANADGSYRMRVILSIRGVRDLRMIGVAGDGHPNSIRRFVVQVH